MGPCLSWLSNSCYGNKSLTYFLPPPGKPWFLPFLVSCTSPPLRNSLDWLLKDLYVSSGDSHTDTACVDSAWKAPDCRGAGGLLLSGRCRLDPEVLSEGWPSGLTPSRVSPQVIFHLSSGKMKQKVPMHGSPPSSASFRHPTCQIHLYLAEATGF